MKTYTYICKFLFLAIFFFALSAEAAADTPVSGYIESNTTWTFAQSPYVVTGNTLVIPGATLTIDPGVTVRFESGYSLQIDGELIARGNDGQMITFTSGPTIRNRFGPDG